MDGGAVQYNVETTQTGLTASIANNRIFLTLQPNFVGYADLVLTATEGPYTLADTVRLTVVGENSGELVRQKTQGDVELFNADPYPIPLTGPNGLYTFTGAGSIVFEAVVTGDEAIRAEVRSDTLFLTADAAGTASVAVTATAPTGQRDTQTFTVTRAQDTGGGGGGGTGQTPSGFKLPIQVRNAQGTTAILHIGFDSTATDGFDAPFDTLAPPPAPSGSFDVRLSRAGEDFFSDIVAPTDTTFPTTTWTMGFDAGTDGLPLTLSWTPGLLPPQGQFLMRDAVNGTFVSLDMRQDSSLTISTDLSFIQKIEVVHTLHSTVTTSYMAGWNLVSLPVQTAHTGFADVFTTGMANTLFGFNGTYVPRDILEHGHGYWLRMSEAGDQTFTGLPISQVTLPLAKGWNIVGGITDPLPLADIQDPESILLSTIYGFEGAYKLADTLQPGLAYWVRATDAGSITLDSGAGAAKGVQSGNQVGAPSPIDFSAFHRVELRPEVAEVVSNESTAGTRAGDGAMSLWFGADLPDHVHPEVFLLPPVPPAGSLDARFTDGAFLQSASEGQVLLQQGAHPMTLLVEAPDHLPSAAYRIVEHVGERRVREHEVKAGEPIKLDLATNQVAFEWIRASSDLDSHAQPTEFRLGQNYPNPFNPTTTIRLDLPASAEVTLEVYTILGQRVATLWTGTMQAGFHRFEFDASGLPSGLYVAMVNTSTGAGASVPMLLVK